MPNVHTGAQLQCSLGTSPGTFTASGSVGNVFDIGTDHISAFGMCQSSANPTVAAATAAAGGVLTPVICSPMVLASWSPATDGSQADDGPAIDTESVCNCGWGGQVSVAPS